MRPIPLGASVAMIFSLAIAFVVSPWAAMRLFRKEAQLPPTETDLEESAATRLYRRLMSLLLRSSRARWAFQGLVLVLLGGAIAPAALGIMKVKMLPFDNKSELQVQLDLPAGATREESLALGQRMAGVLEDSPWARPGFGGLGTVNRRAPGP